MHVHINTNTSHIIMFPDILQILSVPDPQRTMLWEVEWVLVVSEYQFVRVSGVSKWKIIPQTVFTYYVFIQRVDFVIVAVCDNNVERVDAAIWNIQK